MSTNADKKIVGNALILVNFMKKKLNLGTILSKAAALRKEAQRVPANNALTHHS